jgi:hypothetical protein
VINKILPIFIIFYFIIFPFGQLGRIETSFSTIHLIDIIVGIIAVLQTFSLIRKRGETFLGYYFLSFLALCILSYTVNFPLVTQKEALRGFLYLLRLYSYLLFFFAIKDFVDSNLNFVKRAILYMGTVASFFALLQYIVIPDTRSLFYYGWDNHFYRAIGSFLDPNFLGIILVLFILYLFKAKYSNYILFIAIAALALTFSRSSYLALILGLVALNLKEVQIKKTFLVLVLLLSTIILSPKPGGEGVKLERTSTVNVRVLNYQMSIEKSLERPLLGFGYNLLNWSNGENSSNLSHSQHGVDSSILFVLMTTGILGLFSFISLIWAILNRSWYKGNNMAKIVFPSLIALLIHSLFQNSFFYPWVLGWMIIIIAMMESEDVKGRN